MKQTSMSCRVIEDLIPLYQEQLCSDESRAVVEAHCQTCTACRTLCGEIRPAPGRIETPPETSAFKKINRRLRAHKRFDRILCLLLGLIITAVVCFGYELMYNRNWTFSLYNRQLAKSAMPIAETIAQGDFETVFETQESWLRKLPAEEAGPAWDSAFSALQSAWQKAYAGKTLDEIKLYGAGIVSGHIRYTDNSAINLWLTPQVFGATDGKFQVAIGASVWSTDGIEHPVPEAEAELTARYYYMTSEPFYQGAQYLCRGKVLNPVIEPYIRGGFLPEVQDSVVQHLNDFYAKGCRITDVTQGSPRYDLEQARIYLPFTITAEDGTNRAILSTRLYVDQNSIFYPDHTRNWFDYLYPADPAENIVYRESTADADALAAALVHLFA